MASRAALAALILSLGCGAAAPRPAPTPPTNATDARPTPPRPTAAAEAKATYAKGYALASGGDLTAALPLFTRATELDPTLAIAWFDLGGLREQGGDVAGAMAALERCVAADPAFVEARAELGTLYRADHRPEPAIAQFRDALLTTAPFVDPRFTLTYSRGHALTNLAATYVDLAFPAAAAGIAASLRSDPDAETGVELDHLIHVTEGLIDSAPAPALVAPLASLELDAIAATTAAEARRVLVTRAAFVHQVDVDAAARIDRWHLLRAVARLQAVAGDAAAEATWARARTLARTLPLIGWLDTTYDDVVRRVARGQLDAALTELDELMWIELVVQHDRGPAGGQRQSRRAQRDPALAPLRAKPGLAAMTKRYRIPS